jgi:hypothetical protein
MAYHVRVSDEVSDQFSKACKIMGFKQKAVIEGYMKEIIRRAEQVEALKDIDGILGVVVPIFHDREQLDVSVKIDGKSA